MGFYDSLKTNVDKVKKKPPTPVEIIESNYSDNLERLYESILQQCEIESKAGRRRCCRYNFIGYSSDYNMYWMSWKSESPEALLSNVQQKISIYIDQQKQRAPAEIKGNKDALIRMVVDGIFPEQSKSLRDRLMRDLNLRLQAEGFPRNCVSALDLPIIIPYSYSFFTGKKLDFRQVCTAYYLVFSARW